MTPGAATISVNPLGAVIAAGFLLGVVGVLAWMLWVPRPIAQPVARARRSVGGVRRLLVPLEWGVTSSRAVELACRLGREQHADVYLVYLLEIPRTRALNAPLHEGEAERARQALRHAEEIVKLHRLRAVAVIERVRDASEGILRLARELQPDLMVVGVPPLYSSVRGLFGVLSLETILRRAPCEVIVSKMPG